MLSIEELKEDLEEKKAERNKLQGRIDAIMDSWEELGIDSIDTAKEKIEEYKEKIQKLTKKRDKQMTTLLNLLPEDLKNEFVTA
jgi:seryl-tRNA synthetase